jgi:hypothetical protein
MFSSGRTLMEIMLLAACRCPKYPIFQSVLATPEMAN